MNRKDLKKILAGLCIAGLVSGSAVSLTGCAKSTGSGVKPGAGSSTSG